MTASKHAFLGIALALAAWTGARAEAPGASNEWAKIKDDGRRALAIGKVKTAFADRKDIPGRYIRVKFDGHVMQLAGFVPNEAVAKAAEELARTAGQPEKLLAFWAYDEAIESREAYKTFVREQAKDVALGLKVRIALNKPEVRALFKNAETLHVNVSHGKVTVYLVAEAPPETFELETHIKPITGVLDFHYRVVKTY